MSSFPKKQDTLGHYASKILKYLVIGIVLLGIAYIVFGVLQTTFNQEYIGLNYLIFGEISNHLLNGILFLIFSVFAILDLKFLHSRNKILMFIMLLSIFFLAIFIFSSIYCLNQNIFSAFYLLVIFFSDFFSAIANLLPFFIILPLLILFYFKKLKIAAKYKLKNLSFRNNILLVADGKARNFKGLSILEVTNIPKNIIIKEHRSQKKVIEKLMIPGDTQYLHYHLTSLAKVLPEFNFEIRVEKNDVRLRFIITATGIEINDIVNQIEVQRNSLEGVMQIAFPGLKFQLLQGTLLKIAWEEIFGGWGSYKVKFIEKNKIEINKIVENTFISILKFEDSPYFKIINNASQIDSLIRGFLGSQLKLNYVVAAMPLGIQDFEKQKNEIEKKARNSTIESFTEKSFGKDKFKIIRPTKSRLEEEEIRTELINIRHAEITGMWKVSSYIAIKSNDKTQLDNDIQKVKALFSTVFGIEPKILESMDLERNFYKIFMRNLLNNPLTLTSEQLAILLHLPQNPIPSLTRVDIPEFEIPPENKVRDGISIGNILFFDQEMYPLRLTIEELRLNTFICGLIGMGKSRCAMNIMKQLGEKYPDINWICLDWKGEYKFLANEMKSQKIVVLVPGSDIAPVHLNIFDPQNSNSDEHARKLFAIIREIFKSEFVRETELSAQMESVCKEVLRTVIKNPRMRNLNSFLEELKNYGKEKLAENKTIMMTITALINRFDRFRHGILKSVLDVKKSNINFDNLMNEKVIIDLNYLISKGGAKEDARLLMNLVIKYIIDKALGRGVSDTLKHIILIEDAQLLVPSVLREVPETTLVEDIPLLLRGVGESLITVATRPEISADILANSGIKISFKSPYDSEKIARYQNLTEHQEKYLKIMPKREAIVNLPNFQFPFRVITDHFDYEKISDEELFARNSGLSNIYEQNQQNLTETNPEFPSIENNSKNLLDSKLNFKSQNKLEEFYSKNLVEQAVSLSQLQELLKSKPLNKKTVSEKLGIPKNDIDNVLNPFIEEKQILTFLAPVFKKRAKQKLFALPEHKNFIKNEIKLSLEADFLKTGKIGKLSDEDTFDYIWYGNNTFLKVLDFSDPSLNISEISKLLINWFEEAIERGSYEFIVLIPFYDAGEYLRNWLKTLNANQILIFSYDFEDWNKLREFLNNGINPEWHFNNSNNNNHNNSGFEKSISYDPSKPFFSERIETKEIQELPLKSGGSVSLKNNIENNIKISNYFTKEAIQRQWIQKIQNKYGDKLSYQTLERFNKNYPSINELSGELGCSIHNIEKELGGMMNFLKSVEIHDLYDPLNFKQRYFGWKNENLGQNLMEIELSKLLYEKKINCRKEKLAEDINSLIIYEIYLIFLIFDEPDIQKFIQIIESKNLLKRFNRIILIVHTIELKYNIEKKLQGENFSQEIEVYVYDWSNIGPVIRNLALKPSNN